MKNKIVTYLGLLFYLTITATVSVLFNIDLWAVIALLFLLPGVWLLKKLKPSISFLLVMLISALAITFLFESIAYSSGLWYELSIFDKRIFGVFPYEIVFWTLTMQLLIIGIHEYFTDDRTFGRPHYSIKNLWLLIFMLGLANIGIVFSILMNRVVISLAMWWLLSGAILTLIGAMILSHSTSLKIFKKALLTTGLAIPVILIHEMVSLFNFHWVFANPAQYLATINIVGEMFPLERFLFLLVIPFWLIIIYECYLDDGD